MKEIWKDIAGYEGLYQVSNLGKVRSLRYKNRDEVKELYLKPHNRGYLQVELHKDGVRKMFTVHRLVAMAFVNGYADGLIVNHIDENKQNNAAANLEWCTSLYNSQFYKERHPEKLSAPRGPNKNVRPVNQISTNGKVVKTWPTSREVMRELGWSDWSISECCRGNRKSAYGFIWQYAN